jgi:hypothetical protein
LHDSDGHDYERLKTQYYLLPHNIYNYGRFPIAGSAQQGDFILVLGNISGIEYNQYKGQLRWDDSDFLDVTLLDSDAKGELFAIRRPATANPR